MDAPQLGEGSDQAETPPHGGYLPVPWPLAPSSWSGSRRASPRWPPTAGPYSEGTRPGAWSGLLDGAEVGKGQEKAVSGLHASLRELHRLMRTRVRGER